MGFLKTENMTTGFTFPGHSFKASVSEVLFISPFSVIKSKATTCTAQIKMAGIRTIKKVKHPSPHDVVATSCLECTKISSIKIC